MSFLTAEDAEVFAEERREKEIGTLLSREVVAKPPF
jgi:hypothetical protein